MKASILDLRYRMKDVLKAISRNQIVTVMYRGEEKGKIVPSNQLKSNMRVQDTELFGMYRDDKQSVEDVMRDLRGGRYRDL